MRGGPPGPRPTPSSACSRLSGIRYCCGSGTGASPADGPRGRPVRPTAFGLLTVSRLPASDHLAHFERGVLHRRQVLDERFQLRAHGLVGDLLVEAGSAEFLAALPEPVSQFLLDAGGGPHEARQASIGADEFAGEGVDGADADEPGGLLA